MGWGLGTPIDAKESVYVLLGPEPISYELNASPSKRPESALIGEEMCDPARNGSSILGWNGISSVALSTPFAHAPDI
jgi:hypothetical protein